MNVQSILIRKPMLSEADRVFECINQLKTKPLEFAPFLERFAQNLNHPDIHYFAAEDEGVFVGLISVHIQRVLHHDLPVAEIMELVIDEPYRSRSIGELLLNKAIAFAESSGCELIEVASNNSRERAHQFYMRHGFDKSHAKLTYLFKR